MKQDEKEPNKYSKDLFLLHLGQYIRIGNATLPKILYVASQVKESAGLTKIIGFRSPINVLMERVL